MDKIKLGLIGLGYIGKTHLLNSLRLDNAKLVAVADTSKKALGIAKKMGIRKTFSSYQPLLNDNDIDAVIIALPTHLHTPCAKEAAEAGKHILLEKPLARNVKEGNEILATATKNNIKLMIGYPLRFADTFQELKVKIERGDIGEVQLANATNIACGPFFHRADSERPRPIPEWWFKKELTGGGAIMDLGCHMINLLHWYFGEISQGKSYLGYRFNLDLEDHATCLLKFQTGQIAIVNVGWFSQQTQIKVELNGTVGNAHATHESPGKVKTAIQLMMRRTQDFNKPFLRELNYFVQCVKNDSPPSPSGEEALKDLETISQVYKNQIRLD